jgi:hypothetical protein
VITRRDWKGIYELRDDLDDEDKAVLRKLIKHTEKLERAITTVMNVLERVETDK